MKFRGSYLRCRACARTDNADTVSEVLQKGEIRLRVHYGYLQHRHYHLKWSWMTVV